MISAHFKKLINQNNFLESPAFFASKLNVSTSHLNDCVNSVTGKSVTYWLQNSMINEAQRLLYYTENDVKEIAFALGFDDHSYFSRLFKKITNETPLTFRRKFRE
ncbi:MAG: helix-turn-helix domain-containing protein [Bacteroidia bacterium]